jgi:hypothetical protein
MGPRVLINGIWYKLTSKLHPYVTAWAHQGETVRASALVTAITRAITRAANAEACASDEVPSRKQTENY